MIPLWLLDVDGVLNAVTRKPDRSVWPDYRRTSAHASGREWPIWFSPSVVAAICRLVEEKLVEVRWLTTWEDEAAGELSERLGLPALPVAGRAAESGGLTWWKYGVARRVATDRRLVWTDDDLAYEVEAAQWAAQRGLAIAPDPDVGLTGEHLAAIERFCCSCAT